jgi:hypothetical protein
MTLAVFNNFIVGCGWQLLAYYPALSFIENQSNEALNFIFYFLFF